MVALPRLKRMDGGRRTGRSDKNNNITKVPVLI